jgi:hypothetical protein
LLINVILSVATASCFPAFIRQKYQYDTMWMIWKQYKFHKFSL